MARDTFARTVRIGRNRGKARLWIEGKLLTACGLDAGETYVLTLALKRIEFRRATEAPAGIRLRTVSGRRGNPIVDINTDDLLAVGAELFTPSNPRDGVLILEAK